jgi:CRISPR-associated endonuclease/helicase Cas3
LDFLNHDASPRRFSDLSPPARAIWAKSGDGTGHGLLAHLLDVAAVVEALLQFEPEATRQWAARTFGLPEHGCVRWIAAAAGLHDFGKAIPGFQAKWSAGQQHDEAHGLTFVRSRSLLDRHDLATAVHLQRPWGAKLKAHRKWVEDVVCAISAHHGFHFLRLERNNAQNLLEPPEWALARQSMLDAYWLTLNPQGAPAHAELSLPAINWLAGLTSAADWIASNPDWFPMGERVDDLSAYHQDGIERGIEALNRIGWSPYQTLHPRSDTSTAGLLRQILGEAKPPRALQEAGDQLLQSTKGPALMLVEAPMGEGKTEMAFLAHLRLQAANQHRGLYVALPTQATGNAMFKRAHRFLQNFADVHLDLQLVHGGAAMNVDVQQLRGINDSAGDSISASAWLSQRRRPLLSAYGVGTVDQAILATMNVKHHFVRLWGLSNRVVVLDEVHAYDTYTSTLIDALLMWLKAVGSSVILMSATLPRSRKHELLKAWGVEPEGLPEKAYPRVAIADDAGCRAEHFKARDLSPIHVEGMHEDLEALCQSAVDQLAQGGCGAVIVNTVDRAQALYAMLSARVDESVQMVLFHARFPADQRSDIEQRVLSLFGEGAHRPDRALLIATQVAEQSLDIDFDFMLSDLAPIDLLLQRAGRLHRHQRNRPDAHKVAKLTVAGLRPDRLPDLKATAWGYVYQPYILGCTWVCLNREHVLHLPDDIDRLVQWVYSQPALPDDLDAEICKFIDEEAFGHHLAEHRSHKQQAMNVSIDPSGRPDDAYATLPRGNEDGGPLGEENKTRLGRETVTLIPVETQDGLWRVQDRWINPHEPLGHDVARALYQRQIKVSRKSVVNHFNSQPACAAFDDHPLLRYFRPLPLTEQCHDIGSLRLRLCQATGLIYEKLEGP